MKNLNLISIFEYSLQMYRMGWGRLQWFVRAVEYSSEWKYFTQVQEMKQRLKEMYDQQIMEVYIYIIKADCFKMI